MYATGTPLLKRHCLMLTQVTASNAYSGLAKEPLWVRLLKEHSIIGRLKAGRRGLEWTESVCVLIHSSSDHTGCSFTMSQVVVGSARLLPRPLPLAASC